MKTHTVTCLNADSRCTVFVVDVPEKLGFWWAVKNSHTVTFTEGEPFPSGKQLTDVPSDEVFTYYGNGCVSRPNCVRDMDTLLWLLRDRI